MRRGLDNLLLDDSLLLDDRLDSKVQGVQAKDNVSLGETSSGQSDDGFGSLALDQLSDTNPSFGHLFFWVGVAERENQEARADRNTHST